MPSPLKLKKIIQRKGLDSDSLIVLVRQSLQKQLTDTRKGHPQISLADTAMAALVLYRRKSFLYSV